ncbi:NB-ARC protein [Chondrus crispus]|uniref:NB-ARC protein n=1 Tax=Chondrus crispus TaxID=2769 RepID=R7QL94_CHOCR|nr:NB-ARC protein [Chondrus crispus]CDF38251.1 NB-ARC protein [Chondrus crispus]|eukprot:XP_005718136.1 NB-ARC protein [Chondrus crispus]
MVKRELEELAGITGIENDERATNLLEDEFSHLARKILVERVFLWVKKNSEEDSSDEVREVLNASGQVGTQAAVTSTARCTLDVFTPCIHAEHNPDEIYLQLNSRGIDGSPNTCEARLKEAVLSTDRNTSIGATATGKGGVGKTCALRAIAHDDDIKARFSGGVYFMSLGKDASVGRLIEQLCIAVEASGGNQASAKMREQTELSRVLTKMRAWFNTRVCLFIIDDVWAVNDIDACILQKLSILADTAGDIRERSRLLYSTRDSELKQVGKRVTFEPREREGSDSVHMLMLASGANPEEANDPRCKKAVSEILKLCAGLPLALNLAGTGVRYMRERWEGEKSQAWEAYLSKMKRLNTLRSESPEDGYASLDATFGANRASAHPMDHVWSTVTGSIIDLVRRRILHGTNATPPRDFEIQPAAHAILHALSPHLDFAASSKIQPPPPHALSPHLDFAASSKIQPPPPYALSPHSDFAASSKIEPPPRGMHHPLSPHLDGAASFKKPLTRPHLGSVASPKKRRFQPLPFVPEIFRTRQKKSVGEVLRGTSKRIDPEIGVSLSLDELYTVTSEHFDATIVASGLAGLMHHVRAVTENPGESSSIFVIATTAWVCVSTSFILWRHAQGFRGVSIDRGACSDIDGEVHPETDERDVLWLGTTADLIMTATDRGGAGHAWNCLPCYIERRLYVLGAVKDHYSRGGPYNVNELPCRPSAVGDDLTSGKIMLRGFQNRVDEAVILQCRNGVLHVTNDFQQTDGIGHDSCVPDITVGERAFIPAATLSEVPDPEVAELLSSKDVKSWALENRVSDTVADILREVAARHELSRERQISVASMLSLFWRSAFEMKTATMKYVRIDPGRKWGTGRKSYLIISSGAVYLCRGKRIISRTLSLGLGFDPVAMQVGVTASMRDIENYELLSQLSSLVCGEEVVSRLGFGSTPEGIGATADAEGLNDCVSQLVIALTMLRDVAKYHGRYGCIDARQKVEISPQLVLADLPVPYSIAEAIMPVAGRRVKSTLQVLDGVEEFSGKLPTFKPVVVGGRRHSNAQLVEVSVSAVTRSSIAP